MENQNLPKGWVISTLNHVTENSQYGYTTKASEQGNLKFLRTTDITQGVINWKTVPFCLKNPEDIEKFLLKSGDIIISRSGSIGFNYVIKDLPAQTVYASYLIRFRPVSLVCNDFLGLFLKSNDYWEQIYANASGNAMQNINAQKLSALNVIIAPLAEQQEIVRVVESHLKLVDQIKSRLDALPKILEQFRQSVLASAVSGKLTEDWRKENFADNNLILEIQKAKKHWLKNTKHNESGRISKRVKSFIYKVENHEGLPVNWYWGYLEDCLLMIVDCHNKTAPYEASGIPLIRTSNIRDGKFVWNDLKYVDQKTFEFWSKRCIPESGDIIFTREAPMGEAAIIPNDLQVCLGQRTMLLRPIKGQSYAEYFLYVLMDPIFKKKSEEIAVGSGVKHYRVGDVSNLLIPLPPLEEQKEIVERVDRLFALADQIEDKIKNAQERVNLLTQSILAKAFRGELTAQWREENQDLISGENSAEALLKRIEAEKKKSKKK